MGDNMNNLMKKYREQLNITQQEMADKLGIAVSTYNMIENNKRRISLLTAKKVSIILGVSLDELFFAKNLHT